ncbi:G-type lectin S-receptor-like serine/threonine-protein kinase At4g27290 [Salvia splendens]|uniref:G-type lectin S-receptor-like serine/threonine-protein kinase At4g27290 n=1 Tax=Salvia splendens TaxID=180675 RepID=UPI001C268BF1|nr:G-type lectin S-receptor-like serine/threonine-protein kinase At4g27290 [Salvia splendens]
MENFIFTKIVCGLFLFIISSQLSDSADTLLPNQTVAMGETLVSQNQVFELQFLSIGKSRNTFLAIRYKTTPDVVVWVANRNNPITESQGVVFSVSSNGTLVISRNGSVIWFASPSRPASRPLVRLLDTGNLVVVDQEDTLWQGFDHPTDTLLPGMKLVDDLHSGVETNLTSWRSLDDPSSGEFVFRVKNLGLPQLVILNGEKTFYRSGTWNGLQFTSMPSSPSSIFQPNLNFSNQWLISITRPYDSSLFTRLRLDASGFVQRPTMSSRRDMWTNAYTYPPDKCEEYGYCGPHAVCSIGRVQRCQCLKGFEPVSPNDWDLQDWTGGCRRSEPLDCEGGDVFYEVKGVKYPDMIKFWLNMSMSLNECRDECLRNCNCTAYANAYVANGGSGCLVWLGDLLDIKQFTGADSNQNLFIRLPHSERGGGTTDEKEKRRRPIKVVMISVTCGVISAGFIVGVILLVTRRKRQPASDSKINSEDQELQLFKFPTLMAATNGFSRENLIGEGGFGLVYKGKLFTEEEIAVKRLSRTSQQGLKEFKNEVTLIAKLQHRNLVRLLGCCIEGEERLLVYEYLKNKSLDYFVFDQNQRKLLTWPKRFDIIMGIARGLLYLHQDSRLKIIHRDLKTSNILLDGDLNPKISDFGLARIFGEDQCIAKTKRVIGTYGYMAPEYAFDGKYSVKSDVFALGVILLEIVSGKKNRGFDHNYSLLGHAWLLWKEGNILDLMDECLSNTLIASQVKRCIHVGLLCVQKYAEDRPVMSSIVSMLGSESNGAILPDPKEPGFFGERSPSCRTVSSQETITITELEAR